MRSPTLQATELQKQILEKISRQTTSSVREVERSNLVLLLLAGHSNLEIENNFGYSWEKAKRWRYRWLSYEAVFLKLEQRDKKEGIEHDLEQKIRECLSDGPRQGRPSRLTAEQYCQILGVALEVPADSGRPISQWTLNELLDEVLKRGIVDRISRSQLGNFLKRRRGETAQNQRLAKP